MRQVSLSMCFQAAVSTYIVALSMPPSECHLGYLIGLCLSKIAETLSGTLVLVLLLDRQSLSHIYLAIGDGLLVLSPVLSAYLLALSRAHPPRAQHFALAGLFKSKVVSLNAAGNNHGSLLRRQSSQLSPAPTGNGGGSGGGGGGGIDAGSVMTAPRRMVPIPPGPGDPFPRNSHFPPLPALRLARKSLQMGTFHEAGAAASLPAAGGAVPACWDMMVGRSSSHRVLAGRPSPSPRSMAITAAAGAVAAAATVRGGGSVAIAAAASGGGGGGRNVIKRSGSTHLAESPTLLGLLMRSKDSITSGSSAVVAPPPWDDEARMLVLKVRMLSGAATAHTMQYARGKQLRRNSLKNVHFIEVPVPWPSQPTPLSKLSAPDCRSP